MQLWFPPDTNDLIKYENTFKLTWSAFDWPYLLSPEQNNFDDSEMIPSLFSVITVIDIKHVWFSPTDTLE